MKGSSPKKKGKKIKKSNNKNFKSAIEDSNQSATQQKTPSFVVMKREKKIRFCLLFHTTWA